MSAALASRIASRESRSSLGRPRRRVALSALLGLGLSVWAAAVLSAACADALGSSVARRVSSVLSPISRALPNAPDSEVEFAETRLTGEQFESKAEAGKRSHGGKRGHKLGEAHGIRVSAAQVMALASRRAIPEASPVRANESHPAGLMLRSVSGLGLGLEDGDVLTEAAGQKASSVGTVIGIVMAARARHSSEISGRFFRAGIAYQLTVEQPYPPGADPG